MKTTRTLIEIAILLLLVFAAVECFRGLKLPPETLTRAAVDETMVRIHLYMVEHREYPPDLTVLPEREGYCNQINDAWGRRLLYSVDEDSVITLSSLGRDGKPGGEGSDADIVRRHRTRNDDGSLNIDDEFWISDSEVLPGDS